MRPYLQELVTRMAGNSKDLELSNASWAAHREVEQLSDCYAALNRIGTFRAIPYLQRGATSRKRDVRMSAESAIEAIQKRMKLIARPDAPPNADPATSGSNLGVTGPPSVS